MWELAKHLYVVVGKGESLFKLNSFDAALLDAGIANYNHSIQSSIIPPRCTLHIQTGVKLPKEGSILPTILSRKHGVHGEAICAGLAFGVNDDVNKPGLVYELTGQNENEVKIQLDAMIRTAADQRNWMLKDIRILTSFLTVNESFGCVIVAAVLLP